MSENFYETIILPLINGSTENRAAPESEFWEFGIVETSYSPGFDHLEIVNNRCADTLLPIIGRVCMKVCELGFEHATVNHSLQFVNPVINSSVKSRIRIDMDDKVYVEGLYNYDRLKDDESRSIVSKSNMKEVARKLPITPKYVFIQETANLDENVISELGFPKDIYRTIRNVNKRTNMGSLRDNNDISEEFKYTTSDNLFLQYDSTELKILFNCKYGFKHVNCDFEPEIRNAFKDQFDGIIVTYYMFHFG
ncbi:hypothetical protein P3W45_000775 [Vairimorpha bombi]